MEEQRFRNKINSIDSNKVKISNDNDKIIELPHADKMAINSISYTDPSVDTNLHHLKTLFLPNCEHYSVMKLTKRTGSIPTSKTEAHRR
ncbi:hypothetical protein GJ496_003008 [Pomphorhynchus laevis]|nr:hypothetical protein GJ496_003008 [Pomphorhynchus laevis]